MNKLFVSTCALTSIIAGTALADSIETRAAPGLYKEEGGYSAAFPGDGRGFLWAPANRVVIFEGPGTVTTTHQRALIPESAAEMQTSPTTGQVIMIEPRGGYYMEGSRDMLR